MVSENKNRKNNSGGKGSNKVNNIKKLDNKIEDIQDWQDAFTKGVVEEIHKLIEEQVGVYGRDFGELARSNIIASLIASTIYGALVSVPKRRVVGGSNLNASTEEHHKAYQVVKENIQSAVEAGFEGAAKVWSGNSPEYYCNVSIVPEPISKQLN